MISISILGICMAYIAYDSSLTTKTINEMNEKDKMLYAAQEAIERYKTGLISSSINGYSVEVDDSGEDPYLTTNLKKVTVTVHPKNTRLGMQDLVFVTYILLLSNDVPSETTNLTAVPSAQNITLNWSRAINASSYSVKRRAESETNFTAIASGITSDMYTDTDVEAGIRYYYIVWAVNDNGSGPESNEANAIIIINTTGLEPTADAYVRGGLFYSFSNYGTANELIARNGNNSSQKYNSYLKFDLSSIQGTLISAKLRIYGSANGTLSSEVSTVPDDGWTETGITWSDAPAAGSSLGTLSFNSTNRYVELNVTNYCKTELAGDQTAGFLFTSPNSTTVTAVSRHPSSNRPLLEVVWTPAAAPPAPQNLIAEPDDCKAILSWDTVIGAETYNVKRSLTSGGPYTTIANVTSVSYTDSTVTNGTTYYYVVSALSSTGEGLDSNEASTTPDKRVTVTLNSNADTYIRGGTYSANNYGSNAKLEIKNDIEGSNERRIAYLRYNLSNLNGEIISARLRVYGSNLDDSTTVNMGLYQVDDSDWEENTMTYSNAPALGEEIGSVQVDNTQSYKEINVTDYIKTIMAGTKIASVAYAGKDSAKLLSFNSKESISNKPELIILKTLQKPDAPLDLKAVPDNAQVTLSWSASSQVDSYTIKRSTTDGGPYAVLASGLTSAAYVDNSVTNGTEYYYVVSAINAAGESADSNQASATPNTAITVTKNPAADARVESYYPSTNYGTNTVLGVVNDGVNNKKTYLRFSLAGYTNNTPVSAKLRVYGKTSASSIDLKAYKVSNTTWIESGMGSITWNNAPILESEVGTVNMNTTQQYYEIDVSNYIAEQIDTAGGLISIGLNVSSNTVSINSKEAASNKPELIVKMVEGVPKVPQNLVGTGINTKANLTWTASDGAVSYKLKVSSYPKGPYTTRVSGITSTSYQDINLINDTKYYYVVSAVNAKGESTNSNEVCVIPAASRTTRIFYPTDDAYFRGGAYVDINYGTDPNLYDCYSFSTTSDKLRETYIKFDMTGLPSSPVSAQLILKGKNTAGGNNITMYVYKVTDDSWSEYTITQSNSPSSDWWVQNTFSVTSTYAQCTADVTSYAQQEYSDKTLSLNIYSRTSNKIVMFSSKEGPDIPMLKVTY